MGIGFRKARVGSHLSHHSLPLIFSLSLANKPIFEIKLNYHFWSSVFEDLEHRNCGKESWSDRASIGGDFRARYKVLLMFPLFILRVFRIIRFMGFDDSQMGFCWFSIYL